MLLRGWLLVFAIPLAAASLAHAQTPDVNITGPWNGHYSVTDHCDNGTTFRSDGRATATFTQNGSSVLGTIALQWARLSQGGHDCAILAEPATITVTITGTVTGNSFAGVIGDTEGGAHPISGSVSAGSMTLSFPRDPTTSGTFTLDTGSPPVAAVIAGTWNGHYAMTDHCDNETTVSSDGTASVTFTQNGPSALGSVTLYNVTLSRGGHDCAILAVTATITVAVTGTVTGSSFAGVIADTEGVAHPISGSVSATSMTLSFPRDPTTSGTLALSRAGSPRRRAVRH